MNVILLILALAMAGDPFRFWAPGDRGQRGEGPFNAQWHNAVTRAVRAAAQNTSSQQTESPRIPTDTEIWIANVSTEAIEQYTAVGLGPIAIEPDAEDDDNAFRARLCFFTEPLTDGRPWGIAQEPIAAADSYLCVEETDSEPPGLSWIRLFGDADAWSVAQRYAVGEQVTYGGETYAAIESSFEAQPDESAAWLLLGARRGVWIRDAGYDAGDIVVTPRLGRVMAAGVSRVRLTVGNARHQYAGLSGGELVSREESGDADILWKEASAGVQWAVVRFCCATLVVPTLTGEGALTLGAMTCSIDGTHLYTPGGELIMGGLTCAGSGTLTFPGVTGSGSPAFGTMTAAGVGKVYDVVPSGRLYMGAMTASGVGVRTRPPTGAATLSLKALTMSAAGTVDPPIKAATGGLAASAMTCVGVGTISPTSFYSVIGFTVRLHDPILTGGKWAYAWTRQVINTGTGEYEDGDYSGDTSSGPWLFEVNNNLVDTPSLAHVRYRGLWSGVPVYDFDRCCALEGIYGTGSLTMGAMTCAGTGELTTTDVTGSGSLTMGVMTMAGIGKVHVIGSGSPSMGAMTIAGAGKMLDFTGPGELVMGVMTMAGVGKSYYANGSGSLTMGVMTAAGSGTMTAPGGDNLLLEDSTDLLLEDSATLDLE